MYCSSSARIVVVSFKSGTPRDYLHDYNTKKKIPVNIPLIIQKKAHLANRSSKFISENSIILRIAVYYGEVSRTATPNRYAGKDMTNGQHPYNRTRDCTMDGRADP